MSAVDDAKTAMEEAKRDLKDKRKAYLETAKKYYELKGFGGLIERFGPKLVPLLTTGGVGAWLENAGLLQPLKAMFGF